MPRIARVAWIIVVFSSLSSVAMAAQPAPGGFTLQQVMSAPFNSDLIAAPAKNRLAWLSNVEGRRNIWIAMPAGNGQGYVSRQITHYRNDDGQEITGLKWSPDAESLAYVRGGDPDDSEKMSPNPALLPQGAQQDVWLVSLDGSAPHEVGEGRSPTFSPKGDSIAWVLNGQIWLKKIEDDGTKPAQLLHTFGESSSLIWSPDGDELAFVSDRGSHSFIGVYSFSANTLSYLDPGTDHDRYPIWSPDSREIAFIRVPYSKEESFDRVERAGLPWSIRVADVGTGKGHAIWRAREGPGSVFREIVGDHQVFWSANNHLIFPWEGDGWTHLYSVSTQRGTATLLTPGSFEVEDVSLSPDRRTISSTPRIKTISIGAMSGRFP